MAESTVGNLTDADFKRTMLAALRLLAVLSVVATALFWWKSGWQSAALLWWARASRRPRSGSGCG